MSSDGSKIGGCLLLIEYATLSVAIGAGSNLLEGISSSSTGFRFLGVTLVVIGVLLLILLFLSCAKFNFSVELALTKCACYSVPLLIVMGALGIFALVVSTKGGGESIPGIAYKEYHVESYSKWVKNKVNDAHNWENHYKKVIIKKHVCKKFGREYKFDSLDSFHKRKLSPLESSCCKPPEDCNFTYSTPTKWVKPENGTYSNADCNRWDNNPTTLCYDCQSCKAGFLQDVTTFYYYTGIVLVVLAATHFLFGTYLIYLISTTTKGPFCGDYSSLSR
ncbi:Tetraspanin-7 [Bienertia sinuspersici]